MNFGGLIIWTLSMLLTIVSAYKILYLVPINAKSHWILSQALIKTLLKRGHHVTCITSLTFNGQKNENYTEICIDPPLDYHKLLSKEFFFEMARFPAFMTATALPFLGKISSEHGLNDSKVQEFIHRNDLNFDVVINEDSYHESWMMFGHKFRAPIVTLGSVGNFDYFDHNMGLLTPSSHVSHSLLTYTDNMIFFERWYNSAIGLYDWAIRKWIHLPIQNSIARRYFGHLEPLPSIENLIANISLTLVNAHRSLFHPRPSMPTLINIGGAHLKKPKPLPIALQTFIDESVHGVIYFSLGSVLVASSMPKDKLQAFLDTFKQLKQRIIWKYEDDSLIDIPSNVMISKWLPQNDILAHPNVILFISHGGMFSNLESVHHGVPMIMIPFVGDQVRNGLKAQAAGYAKYLYFESINVELLTVTVHEILTNRKYSDKAKELQTILNDNMMDPKNEAIWWIEYVCRYSGAKHLKSHSVHMIWFQYLLLDVILFNIVTVSIALYASYILFKKIYYCRKSIIIITSNKKKV